MNYLVKIEHTVRMVVRVDAEDDEEAKAVALVMSKLKVSEALMDAVQNDPDVDAIVDRSVAVWSRIEA